MQDDNSKYKPVKYFFDMSFKNLKEAENIEGIIAMLKDHEETFIKNNNTREF